MRRKRKPKPQAQPHEADQRIKACQRALELALADFQCIMVPEVVIRGTRIETAVRILPRPA
jgi:hypothetical protein